MACLHEDRALLWAPTGNATDKLWRCNQCMALLRFDQPYNKWVSIGYRAVPEQGHERPASALDPDQLNRLFARIRDVRRGGATLREACQVVATEAGVDAGELFRRFYASL